MSQVSVKKNKDKKVGQSSRKWFHNPDWLTLTKKWLTLGFLNMQKEECTIRT